MKTLFAPLAVSVFLLISGEVFAQVSITTDGSAPHLSAMLDIKSTSRGLLVPRLDNTEMNSIGSPATGLMVFNTSKNNFFYYSGSVWDSIAGSCDFDWVKSGNNMYSAISGMVGIGTSSPAVKLHVYDGEVKVETNPGQNSIDLSQGTVAVNGGTSSTARFVNAINNTWTWGMGKTNTGNSNFHLIYYPTSRWDLTVLTSNGNVGIGNTSPSQKLDIGGNMKLAGAFYDVNDQPGTLGQVLSSTGSNTDWIDLPPDNDWTVSSNDIYSAVPGNVGIGTSSPAVKLHVYDGEVKVETNPGQNSIDLSQGTVAVNGGTSSTARFVNAINNTWTWGMGKTNTGNSNFHLIYYPTSRWDLTVLTSNGNVGIGNTSPSQKLDIGGNMKLAGAFYDVNNQPGTTGQVLSSTGSNTDWIDLPPDNDWTVSSNNIYSAVSGNVGIGTSIPSEKLHVYNGEVKIETNPDQNSIDLSQGTIVVNEGSSGTPRFVTSIANTWTWGMGKTNTGNSNFHLIYYPTGRWDFTVLTSNGNVGIGNTSPSQKLDVGGNMKLAGAFYDVNNDPGSSGQILSSTGSSTDWISPGDFLDQLGYSTANFIRSTNGGIEAFGKAKATGGVARISLAVLDSDDVDLHQDYYVFLTPLSANPVYMTVTRKDASSFSVLAFDSDGNPADCEFDYRVMAKLKE